MKGCSKGLAISVMSNVLGYEKRDVIAFGDSNNDLPMFQAAGFKVAMGNGSKDLKSQADYVTGALEDGGIRQALEYLNLIKKDTQFLDQLRIFEQKWGISIS